MTGLAAITNDMIRCPFCSTVFYENADGPDDFNRCPDCGAEEVNQSMTLILSVRVSYRNGWVQVKSRGRDAGSERGKSACRL